MKNNNLFHASYTEELAKMTVIFEVEELENRLENKWIANADCACSCDCRTGQIPEKF